MTQELKTTKQSNNQSSALTDHLKGIDNFGIRQFTQSLEDERQHIKTLLDSISNNGIKELLETFNKESSSIKKHWESLTVSDEMKKILEQTRINFLGKKGLVTEQMSKLSALPVEERKVIGAEINSVRNLIVKSLDEKKSILEDAEINAKLSSEKIDITLPTRPELLGKTHPISQVMSEITSILAGLGFEFHEGPSVEDDFHNFTALNIPENHPARQMHDTFYLPPAHDGTLRVLRTHTSPVQIRAMENSKPPFRIFSMGRTYRSDSDMTHTPMFHQVEALYIDKNINFGHLKWVVNEFITQFFGEEKAQRFRPSFFPFTEPSAEVDIDWGNGKWLEIMGCGMVNARVLKNVGVDPEVYSGFAFGAGIERMAMLKYNIPDLRQFFESDLRWLEHYGF